MPKIPKDIRDQLLAAQQVCDNLAKLAAQENLNHKFTLDGRFVGDVGELIASRFFKLALHKKQRSRHDGTCTVGQTTFGVQVKCRRKSTVLDISWQPELLLVLLIDHEFQNWEVVYNGSGEFLSSDDGYTAGKEGRLMKGGQKKARRVYLDDLRTLKSTLQIPSK